MRLLRQSRADGKLKRGHSEFSPSSFAVVATVVCLESLGGQLGWSGFSEATRPCNLIYGVYSALIAHLCNLSYGAMPVVLPDSPSHTFCAVPGRLAPPASIAGT